jgi:hypothetical protein
MLLKSLTKQHMYLIIYRRLYITLFDQFVIQSQDPLNLCCSVNNQFPINNCQSREKTMSKMYVPVFR